MFSNVSTNMENEDYPQTYPSWLRHHDHLHRIPETNSFVFYPYNLDEANEEELNKYYNEFGYTVIRKPKAESEYRSAEHAAYKVLILEPNYNKEKIDHGCELLGQQFAEYFSHLIDHKESNFQAICNDFDQHSKVAESDDPVNNKRINDTWDHIIKCAVGAKWKQCVDACLRLNDMITPHFQVEIDDEKYSKYGVTKREGEKDHEWLKPRICVPGKCDETPILHANCWRIARWNGQGCPLYHSIRYPDGTLNMIGFLTLPEPPKDNSVDEWCFVVIRGLADCLGNWHLAKLTQELLKDSDDYDVI